MVIKVHDDKDASGGGKELEKYITVKKKFRC